MELTKDNLRVYAARYYDNYHCISEDEFLIDLGLMTTIKRMLSKYMNGHTVNLRLLVNNVITFYNCFEHHAATNLLRYKLEEDEIPYINTILRILSFPIISGVEVNIQFYKTIQGQLNEAI